MRARVHAGCVGALPLAGVAALIPGAPPSAGAGRVARCASRPTWRRETTSSLDNRVPMRMRDGVTLYADVYRPAGDGRYPVLALDHALQHRAVSHRLRRGRLLRAARLRLRLPGRAGTPRVGGRLGAVLQRREGRRTTPSSGPRSSPGPTARSRCRAARYLGQNQWRAAQAAPPSLVTIFPMVASTSIYHDWITLNGGWRLSFNFGWGPVRQESRIMQNPGPHTIDGLRAIHYDQVQWHLPLNTMQQLVGRHARFYDDWLAHPDYDAYWKPLNVEELFDKIAIPVHTFGGWFDIFSQGTLRGYVGMSHKGATETSPAREPPRDRAVGTRPVAEVRRARFRPDANVDAADAPAALVRLLAEGDRQRAGQPKPPVKLFVMGRNEWVYEREYPLARTEYRPLYFSSGGSANAAGGDGRLTLDEAGRRITAGSVPLRSGRPGAVGGRQQLLRHAHGRRPAGPATRSRAAATSSSTPPTSCQEELEATGPVKVVLYASSDAVGHRLRRQAGRRLSRRLELQHGGGNPARALPREPDAARASSRRARCIASRSISSGTSVAFLQGTPDPRPRDEQPLSAVRSQSEHGRRLWHDGGGQGGGADHLPRRRARASHVAAAGDPTAGTER